MTPLSLFGLIAAVEPACGRNPGSAMPRLGRLGRLLALVALVFGIFAASIAKAQQQPPAPRIAVVFGASPLATMLGPEPSHPYMRALLKGLRDLGYVEGQNIIIERRSLEGHYERAPEVFAELFRLTVAAIVAAPVDVARAAHRATTAIPIVVGDAVVDGPDPVAVSLARPGGNVTGLGASPLMWSLPFQLLKEALPDVSRIAVLTESLTPELVQRRVQPADVAARALGLTLSWTEVEHIDQIADAFEAATRDHPDALLIPPGAALFAARRQIAALALRHRLPTITSYRELVEEGALICYNLDNREIYRRVATYVDKILKGARPADLPIERPDKFYLSINMKTAKALGLTIPLTMLYRADEVIE
jgi:putative tryptophan/tyrosine transport system substrate-binding protein